MHPQLLATAPGPPALVGPFGNADDDVAAAFRLAHFLHPDRATALRVTTAALAKVEVTVSAQDKRLYYHSRGKGASTKAGIFRRKVWMGEKQLLQRLVAIESEPFERAAETAASPPLSPEEGVVRFVKHLFRITVRRSSFYVALGVGRVLHAYTTVETKRFYDALGGDIAPDRAEDYFRARKAVLMREICERFGDALSVVRAAHGEERFETVDSGCFAALVGECLERFTPWGTACPPTIPPGEAPRGDEHESEMARMHTMLHPDCFGRLASWLGLAAPSTRLEVPALSFASGGAAPPGRHGDPPPLTKDERNAIDVEIRKQAQSRRRSAAGLLRCDVDGKAAAYLDPAGERRVRFDVPDGAERIEVFAREADGDVPLASYLLARDGATDRIQAGQLSIVLEGGQRLSFAIEPSDAGSFSDGTHVEITYREPLLPSLLRTVLQAKGRKFFVSLRVLAAVGVSALAAFLVLSPRLARPPATEEGPRAPVPTPAQVPPSTAGFGAPAPPPPTVAVPPPAPREREVEVQASVLPLGAIRTVWIEAAGEGGEGLPADLGRRFAAGGVLTLASSRDVANALLRLRVRAASGGVTVEAELRSADGGVLWPAPGKASHYAGAVEDISRLLASDLARAAAAARKASPKRPPAG